MRVFLLVSIFAFTGLIAQAGQPTTAKEFNKMLDHGDGGAGGAGNGGDPQVSQFYMQALAGVRSLALTETLSEDQVDRLKLAIKPPSKVYFVDFQLCDDDANSDCSDETSYVARNFPKLGRILVDSRDRPRKWKRLSLSDQRRIAAHEFSGLAGIELSNHYYTSQIKSNESSQETQVYGKNIFERFNSKSEISRYFKLMNDLYYFLPGAPSYFYAGEWGKMVVIRPTKAQYATDKASLLKGEKYAIRLIPLLPSLKDPGIVFDLEHFVDSMGSLLKQENWIEIPKRRVIVEDFSHRYQIGEHMSYQIGDCLRASVIDGEVACEPPFNYYPAYHWKRRWHEFTGTSSRFERVFAPSVSTGRNRHDSISAFSCKALDENHLICRQIYSSQVSVLADVNHLNFEYAFYQRIKLP